MGSFAAVLGIVARRSLGNRRLLATMVVGVIVAAGLAASVIIYSDAVQDLGLSYALRNQPIEQLDIQVNSSGHPARRREYGLRRDITDRLLRTYAGGLIRDTVRHGYSATFFLTEPAAPRTDAPDRPRANFQFFERLNEHVHLTAGRQPRSVPRPYDPANRPEIEVLLGKEFADRFSIEPGRAFDLHPFWRQDVRPVRVVVAGLIEPNDPKEEYWLGRTDRFDPKTQSWPTFLFFTDESTYVEVLASYLPDLDSSYQTFAFVNRSAVDARNARQVEFNLRSMETAFRQDVERTTVESKLADTIGSFRQKLFFTRLPLFALMLQVIGIVLYYLVMVTTMLVERQTGEIALLKSRGASTLQIMIVYAIEGSVLALAGVLLGPPLAAGVIALLGPTPPFKALSDNSLLTVHLSAEAYLLAVLGAMLSLAALLWPAYRATRNTIVHYKAGMGRPPRQPAFLRYYLDLFLIAVGAFLFYELRQRGSLVTERLFGDLSTDPLLLVAPSLFMLMIALLVLRLFPVALSLVSWLARGMSGAAMSLGLVHMVRAPVHYSRVILLLILVSAVGVFASGFRATLNRSYEDRIDYQAGAEQRLEGIRQRTARTRADFAETVSAATGVQDLTPVMRIQGSYTLSQFRTTDFTILGVRPDEFARIAFWRDDFAGESLGSLLRPLRTNGAPATAGPSLPPDAARLGVWVRSSLPLNAYQVWARLEDSTGTSWDYRLNNPPPDRYQPDTWLMFYADLDNPAGQRALATGGPPPSAALHLHSISVRLTTIPQAAERASVFFDDVQSAAVTDLPFEWWSNGFASPTLVEGFESLDGYELMTGQAAQTTNSAITRSELRPHGGGAAAQLTFPRERGGLTLFGIRSRDDGAPLYVLASDTFLARTKKKVGDTIQVYVNQQYVQARIAGRFKLFPTYRPDPESAHLLVANLNRLRHTVSRLATGADPGNANEAWLAEAAPNLTRDSLRPKGIEIDKVVTLSELRAAQQRDPLVAASWEGILFISFGAVLLLTSLGFVVYSYLSAQTRALEFAILRTMGFSSRQIVGLVAFEQVFVIACGVVTGTLLGLPLARLMIGYMGVTETGAQILPPFISQVSWGTVAVADGLLAAMFVATIAALVLLYSRLAVHRALRMGEL